MAKANDVSVPFLSYFTRSTLFEFLVSGMTCFEIIELGFFFETFEMPETASPQALIKSWG